MRGADDRGEVIHQELRRRGLADVAVDARLDRELGELRDPAGGRPHVLGDGQELRERLRRGPVRERIFHRLAERLHQTRGEIVRDGEAERLRRSGNERDLVDGTECDERDLALVVHHRGDDRDVLGDHRGETGFQ